MKAARGLVLVVLLLASACAQDEQSSQPVPEEGEPEAGIDAAAGSDPAGQTVVTTSGAVAASCPGETGGAPWSEAATAIAQTIYDEDGVKVSAVRYPRPSYPAKLWSQWGQGIVTSDGRYLSAIGDHDPVDGNAYIYEFDPKTEQLTQIVDVLEVVPHTEGDNGYGKIHAQMVAGGCGDIYVATYWGRRAEVDYTSTYRGDRLLRLDSDARTVTDLGVLHEEHGLPALASWPEGGLVYAAAVDPSLEPNHGDLVVYDTSARSVSAVVDDADHIGFRSLAVGSDGQVYYSVGNGRIAVFDPRSGATSLVENTLPGEWLRAATNPAPDGTIYGVTRNPEEFFTIESDGMIRSLGPARGYTTSLAIDGNGRYLYYVPGAHGNAWELGTPLIRVDTDNGEQELVVELNEIVERQLGLRLGGTYNLAIDPETGLIFAGFNAGSRLADEPWGEIVLLAIELRS